MNCKNCGAALFETSKFCPECGTPVEAAAEENKTESAAPVQEPAEAEPVKNEEGNKSAETVPEKVEAETKPEGSAPEKTDAETKPAVMDAEEIIKEVIAASEHPAEASAIPTEEEIKENLEAVESITDDLPEIAVIEHVEDIPVQTPAAEEPMSSQNGQSYDEATATNQKESSRDETSQPDESQPRKGSKAVIAAVIFIVIAIILAAAAYMLSRNAPDITPAAETTVTELYTEESLVSETESVTETTITEAELATSEKTTVTETEMSEVLVSETEATETEASETEVSEETSAEISETAAQDGEIVIVPETHDFAMGTNISAEISLSAAGAQGSVTDTTLLAVYYNIQTEHVGPKPIIAIVRVGSDEIEVEPTSYADDMSVFEYGSIIGAAASLGHFPNEIDVIAFRSNGAPIDVYSVSVINE